MRLAGAALAFSLALAGAAVGQPTPAMPAREGDFVLHDFRFRSGERLPELRLHYRTLGAPVRDSSGAVINAVLILHGTGGSGAQFLRPQFAGELFGPGQLLDTQKYFIILPDDIGHGRSSKPSDGLREHFPHYDYDDMVRAEHALVTEGLGVARLRLIMGTSMGCMHSFMWAEMWPDAERAVMPLACLPVAIAGRNRLWRRMIIEAIERDSAWDGGEYKTEPGDGLRAAADILTLADHYVEGPLAEMAGELDANDLIYQVDSSRDYDPSAGMESIKAPVMWVNSADDFINPPELGIAEREAARLRSGRFVLLPISNLTHGHGTHTWAVAWKGYLAELLARSGG